MALDRYHLTKRGDEWRLKRSGPNCAQRRATTQHRFVVPSDTLMITRRTLEFNW